MSEKVQQKPKNFPCTFCEKKFVTALGLKKHTKTTHNPTHFACNFCTQSFTSKSSYNKHLKNHREERKLYSCSLCEKSFSHAGDLLHHLRVCSKKEKNLSLSCKVCNKQFDDESSFKGHMKVHSRNPYSCSLCPCIFNSQMKLDKHMRFHLLKIAKHACKACEKDSASKDNLKKNKRIHAENALVCTLCKITFSNIRKFDNHVKSHAQKNGLRNEMPSECVPVSASQHNTAINVFRCGNCNIHSSNLEDLKIHVSSHTITNNQDSALVQQTSTDMGIQVDNISYMCDVCKKYIQVENSTDLNIHKKSHSDLHNTCINNSSLHQVIPKLENVHTDDVIDSKNPSLANSCVTNISNYDTVKKEGTLIGNNAVNRETLLVNDCSTSGSDEKKIEPFSMENDEFFIRDSENTEEDFCSVNYEFPCDVCKDNFISFERLEKHSKIHIQKISSCQET